MSASAKQAAAARYGIAALILLSIPIALYGLSFAWFGPNSEFKTRIMTLPLAAFPHFVGGGIALLIGGFQFSKQLRRARPQLHRWLGRTYLAAVIAAGLGGFAMATSAHGGFGAQLGFALLALVWLGSAIAAWRAIRRNDIRRHRQWMMRNFALTFAAVTLRFELPLLQNAFGVSFDDAYRAIAWLSWVPNLLLVEWLLLARERLTLDSTA